MARGECERVIMALLNYGIMALLNYGVGHILKGFHNISIILILERHNRVHCTNSFALQNPPDLNWV